VHVLHDKPIPDFVTIIRIHGPLLFGATDKVHRVMDGLDGLPPVVIVRLRNMTAIDATGLRALEDLSLRLRESGRAAIFCGARDQPRAVMAQAGFGQIVGVDNVCANIDAALVRANAIIASMQPR
jgi:SulP family sulfate permease